MKQITLNLTIMNTKYNKSEIFSNAWKLVKSGAYNLSQALSAAWKKAKTVDVNSAIQELKNNLVRTINADRRYNNSLYTSGIRENYLRIVYRVKESGIGFASEIATTVDKFEKCSEKQAYWIAKAAIENGLNY